MKGQYARIRDSRSGRNRKATELDRTRLRFNWGYHDGAWEIERNRYNPDAPTYQRPDGLTTLTIREQHHDPAYAEGYCLGIEDAKRGRDTRSSAEAWAHAAHRAFLSQEYVPYRIVENRRQA